jgi:hypothetical protein
MFAGIFNPCDLAGPFGQHLFGLFSPAVPGTGPLAGPQACQKAAKTFLNLAGWRHCLTKGGGQPSCVLPLCQTMEQ